MKKILASMILPAVLLSGAPADQYLITGTYTDGGSKGIYVYEFAAAKGQLTEHSHIDASNPSFVAVSPDTRFVYAVHENGKDGDGGEISAYSFDKTGGTLKLINTQKTNGDYPCYVTTDRTGRWAFAANYGSGNFSVFPIKPDGSLQPASTKIQHAGSGANKERQEGPHVHSTFISPDNKWLYVSDLGIDKIMIYSFDAETGELKPAAGQAAESRPGSGPRHVAFHPTLPYLFLIEEITGTVVTYRMDNGKLTEMERVSAKPSGSNADAGSADIRVSPEGRFLYASNRGELNDIVIFSINRKTAKLKQVGNVPVGKGPRNFSIDPSGTFLFVANQLSDNILRFRIDRRKGTLTEDGVAATVSKPVCLAWIAK